MLPSPHIPIHVFTCFSTKELQKEHYTEIAFTTIHFDEFCVYTHRYLCLCVKVYTSITSCGHVSLHDLQKTRIITHYVSLQGVVTQQVLMTALLKRNQRNSKKNLKGWSLWRTFPFFPTSPACSPTPAKKKKKRRGLLYWLLWCDSGKSGHRGKYHAEESGKSRLHYSSPKMTNCEEKEKDTEGLSCISIRWLPLLLWFLNQEE